MEWLVNNWYMVLGVLALIISIISIVLTFLASPRSEQLNKVREWLLYAVTMAEKEFGAGTGKIKLRYVYDMFVTKFPWVAQVITFAAFSGLVDEALETMKEMLDNNEAAKELVDNTKSPLTDGGQE